MRTLVIACLVSPTVFAHPGHEHVGLLAHGTANPDLSMVLFAAVAVSCAWALSALKRRSR